MGQRILQCLECCTCGLGSHTHDASLECGPSEPRAIASRLLVGHLHLSLQPAKLFLHVDKLQVVAAGSTILLLHLIASIYSNIIISNQATSFLQFMACQCKKTSKQEAFKFFQPILLSNVLQFSYACSKILKPISNLFIP